jgi:polar amino acid transport system substrate-binding protein
MRRLWLWIACGLGVVILIILVVQPEAMGIFPVGDRTWQAVQARGVWRVGMDPSFPPFEVLNSAGNPIGFDVELAEEMAKSWGVKVEIVAVGFDSLLDAMHAGRFDSIVSAFPYDERLTRDVAFSSAYFEAGIYLVVRQGSAIQDVKNLAHRSIAVEWGSTGDMVGRRLQRTEPTIHLAQYATPQEAVEALWHTRSVDALLVDNVTLRQAQGQGAPVIAVGPVLEGNPYVIVMPLSATVLHEKIEQTLRNLHNGGAVEQLTKTWFVTVK